ncbi:unnamed protein product [Adineta ricciae]|uniref:Uncharacterized protein n=1 Tax=Adineta ricciae TaxID=249248 RepID=A0A816EGB8_ADIRI|nr:unnamed protein product [Adineta ricciae]
MDKMTTNEAQCFLCKKHKFTYSCRGCSNEFCFDDLTKHRQDLTEEFNTIINNFDQFRENLQQRKENPQNSSLFIQIDQWEKNSIEMIRQTAQQCRRTFLKENEEFLIDIEEKFNKLIKEIKEIQRENEVNEMNLKDLKEKLTKISKEFNDSSEILIEGDSQTFIKRISVKSTRKSKLKKWKRNGSTICGGNGKGDKLNQLSGPEGIFIDKHRNIFIADRGNHRIVRWKRNENQGTVVAGGNGKGNSLNQLNQPTSVIVDEQNNSIIIADSGNRRVMRWFLNENQSLMRWFLSENQPEILIDNIRCLRLTMDKFGFVYVSDWEKHEVIRWKMGEKCKGTLVAGGNGEGDQLNQFNCPNFLFVDDEQSIYVSDWENHRVMKWRKDAQEGIVVAGGNGCRKNPNQLNCPHGIIVDHGGRIYVADRGNHRIMRWCEGDEEGEIIVGGNGKGNEPNELFYPLGLSFDGEGNLYVVDNENHRIERFDLIV